ncbi:MAG: hypothetical protein HeimC3_21320 [Candidatus Heimdallarchaeota archaeon LC_3]|nr:MAG: hypothetical protein HeimC3_21320 [Candidatus Heimdallarchaeota archaeon LC_3]
MNKIVLCGDGTIRKTTLRLKYMGKGFQLKSQKILRDFLKDKSYPLNIPDAQLLF